MRVMKRISIISAMAIALVVAACGSDGQRFTRDFNDAQKPLEQLLADVGSSGTDSAKMEQLADGLDDTAAAMRKLEPPSDAKDELDAFVKEVEAGADSMRDVAKAVSGGKPDAMTSALGELQQHMTAVSSAQQALQTAVN
jgi:uncharacterized protein Yka (UPF0111/DUF47 family)